MAYYFLFPENDTTIYSHPDRLELNTGMDEILEIVKEKGSSDPLYYPSRALIKFKNDEIKSLITDIIGSSTFNDGVSTVSLQLLSSEHKNLSKVLNLDVFPVSQSWNEGTGRFSNLPTSSDGCSWVYRDDGDVSKTKWTTLGTVSTGLTYGSSSIFINELPSGSSHELTINGIDFIPVISTSIFDNSDSERYVHISGTIDDFGANLATAINSISSSTQVIADVFETAGQNTLTLSGSGIGVNVTISTSSITGNDQKIFSSSIGNFSVQGATTEVTTNFNVGTSGSIIASGITEGGGVWYTGSGFYATQQFLAGDPLDTNFDVTTIIQKFSASLFADQTYPLGIDNNGFIIKQPDVVETNTSSSFGELKYFSVDTHTIFPPRLVFKWDDSIHNYHSSAKQSGDLNVSLYRNKKEYNQNDEAIFRIHVRDKYPTRAFTSTSNYLDVGYFTTGSYYSIRDAYSEEEVIPFDNCTKMSADADGMYFKIFIKGLQPERYYRILFKHINNEGTTIYDNDYYFKVIR